MVTADLATKETVTTDSATKSKTFAVQRSVRGPWRRYLDSLVEHRPTLHAYCRRLTGNVWDGEDLMQDTLVRVFALLGKIDAKIENPRAYLLKTASNLWIDRQRRLARERALLALEVEEEEGIADDHGAVDAGTAAKELFQSLHPQERAALLLKDVLDLSLDETATTLGVTVGSVKSALHRARGRLDERRPRAGLEAPPPELVEGFLKALRAQDLEALRELCADGATGELVGGAELDDFEKMRTFLSHAHRAMPRLGFGTNPWWKTAEYEGETVALGFRTLDGVEGLNEVHRIEATKGKISRLRTYCFCPETVTVVAKDLGLVALPRPHRSPSLGDAILMLVGLKKRPRVAAVSS